MADDRTGPRPSIADPVEFTGELLARATQLLITLDHDVSGLEAEQDDERKRIEQDWQRQQQAVDLAKDRLARMHSHARQIAAHKARLAEFEVAVNPLVPPRPPDEVTVDSFLDAHESDRRRATSGPGASPAPSGCRRSLSCSTRPVRR